MTKPNVLLIFSDQHRYFDLGSSGNPEVKTPNFDRFASTAVCFTQCVSNSPLCVPARGSLLTGLLPHRHRAITNDLPIDPACASLATVLAKNGYATGYIGKWHLAGIPRDQAVPLEKRLGFTSWKAANCNHDYARGFYFDEDNQRHSLAGYEPAGQADLCLDFIAKHQDRPWCCVLSFGPPHDPYQTAPYRHRQLYAHMEPALRGNVPDKVMVTSQISYGKDQVRQNYQGYYAHITALDEQFGRILDRLEQTGQLDNTILVYTSDHGDMLGSQGLANKQLPYEESIRVPLLARLGQKTFCGSQDGLISLVDLPVSILGLAGFSFPGQVDGKNLQDLFTDPQAEGLDQAYILDTVPCHQSYARGGSEWRGIRTRRYTYARSADASSCWLFDNQKDPLQLHNLADDEAGLRASLEQDLARLVKENDDFLPWQQYIKKYGYQDAWNESQAHFDLPLLH